MTQIILHVHRKDGIIIRIAFGSFRRQSVKIFYVSGAHECGRKGQNRCAYAGRVHDETVGDVPAGAEKY